MRLENKVTYFDLKFIDKEVKILIECIRKSKLKDCRDQVRAWEMLEEFIGLLDRNDKYEEKYIEEVGLYLGKKHKIDDDTIEIMLDRLRLQIEEDPVYVFHYDSEDYADFMFEASRFTS